MNKTKLHESLSKVFPKMAYTLCPEQDLNLGRCRMAIFKECQPSTLTTQPPQLDITISLILVLKSIAICDSEIRQKIFLATKSGSNLCYSQVHINDLATKNAILRSAFCV